MLVMAAAMGPISPQGRLTAWGLAVGDASYSLYLAHPFVLRPFRVLWIKVIGPRFDLIFLALAALGAVSVSLALYRVVERPISSRLQAWLKREIPRPNAQRVNFALRREA